MLLIIITLVTWLSLFLSSVPAYPAVFNISSGNVAGLIAAINAANSSGEENTIKLEPGTYTLTSVYNKLLGITGLPVITSVLRINGGGAESTIIERDSSAAAFRILQIGTSGKVTLVGLTVRGGLVSRLGGCCQGGGGILNLGDLTIEGSIIDAIAPLGFVTMEVVFRTQEH